MKLTKEKLENIISEELNEMMPRNPNANRQKMSKANIYTITKIANQLAKKYNLSARLAGVRPKDTSKMSNVRWGYALDLQVGDFRYSVEIRRRGEDYEIDQGVMDSWNDNGFSSVVRGRDMFMDRGREFEIELEKMIKDMFKQTGAPKIRLRK